MPPSAAAPGRSPGYSRYVLGLLFVVYVFNFVDRQILSILLDPIKHDLGVSDTAMGFLTGCAFAVFYTFAGIPIARYADTGVRRSVIAAGAALWSAMTAASGFAQSFAQLALARIGVGVGEAACSPPAHSLISDYFPPERRATALAVYASGIHFGTAFGYLAGGAICEAFGWRAAFFVVGLPGLLVALLVRATVREPSRRGRRRGRARARGRGVSRGAPVVSRAAARRGVPRVRGLRARPVVAHLPRARARILLCAGGYCARTALGRRRRGGRDHGRLARRPARRARSPLVRVDRGDRRVDERSVRRAVSPADSTAAALACYAPLSSRRGSARARSTR